MLFQNWSVERKVRFGMSLGIVALIAIGWFSYSSTTELFKAYYWVRHSHEVLRKLGDLNTKVGDVQRGTLSYIITGSENSLSPYRTSAHLIPGELKNLSNLTEDNPNQQKRLSLLGPAIEELLASYASLIEKRKTEGPLKIVQSISQGEGQRSFDSVQEILRDMQEEERFLLSYRESEENYRSWNTSIVIIIVSLFSLVAILGAGFNIIGHIQREKSTVRKLLEKDELIFQFIEGLPLSVLVVDRQGDPYFANHGALELLGRAIEPRTGLGGLGSAYPAYIAGTDQVYPPDKMPTVLALQGTKTAVDDMEIRRPDGKAVPVQVWGSPIYGPSRDVAYGLIVYADISERKKHLADLKNLSIRDELTGLHNRRGFMGFADQQLKLAERMKTGVKLIYIDLDGLKKVNDNLGHQAGDEMLVEFGRILADQFRKSDIIARMGGDEFAILALEPGSDKGKIVDRLRDKVEERNKSMKSRFPLDFSVGIAGFDASSPCDLDSLIAQADGLMYKQKLDKRKLRPEGYVSLFMGRG